MSIKFFLKLILIATIFSAGVQIGLGQKSIIIGDVSAGQAKNLSKVLDVSCDQSVNLKVQPGLTVEIRHDRRSSQLAGQIAFRLRSSLSRLFDVLRPSSSTKIVVFVAGLDRVPTSYEVSVAEGVDFVYPIVYDSDANIDLDCDGITKLCETIYTTIPHELTHHFLDGKLASDATWLNEGLAEYVSGLVSSELSPKQAFKREVETLPEVSLNSVEIRSKLLEWSYTPETLSKESLFQYGAAHQMVRRIVAEAERQNVQEPLNKLLVFLKKQGTAIRSGQSIRFINEDLKVDVKGLGTLDATRKSEILEHAVTNFWRDRNSKRTAYKYNSLVTFAYLDITLSDSLLTALVEEIFDKRNPRQFQCLAAKALTTRLDHVTFERIRVSHQQSRFRLGKFRSSVAFAEYLNQVKRACGESSSS